MPLQNYPRSLIADIMTNPNVKIEESAASAKTCLDDNAPSTPLMNTSQSSIVSPSAPMQGEAEEKMSKAISEKKAAYIQARIERDQPH
jgi:hypothetical protein